MPLSRVAVGDSAAAFDAALAAALATGARVFVLFTGAGSPSWCPDCETAKPLLAATLEEAGGAGAVALLEVPLARAGYSGNAAHWARAHAGVKLQRIPTLAKWCAGGERAARAARRAPRPHATPPRPPRGKAKKVAEIVEGECGEAARVRELVLE